MVSYPKHIDLEENLLLSVQTFAEGHYVTYAILIKFEMPLMILRYAISDRFEEWED